MFVNHRFQSSQMSSDLELSKSFSSNGWTIRYGVFGEQQQHGQTIVFVHGTPWSSAVFKPLANALLTRGNYRIVLYDLAGYGQSQHFHNRSVKEDVLFVGGMSIHISYFRIQCADIALP